MKRTVALTAGLAALVLVAYVGSRLGAQTGGGAATAPARAATPQSRIALINLTYVIKGYKKYQNFQGEFKTKMQGHETAIKDKAGKIESLSKEAQNPTIDSAAREAKEKQVRDLKREIEDLNATARSELSKLNDQMVVLVYKEVRDAAQRHAMAHGYEVVFHYNDATTQADYDSAPNITRKMNSTGLMPFYWSQGMDISADVLGALNTHYQPKAPATGGARPQQ